MRLLALLSFAAALVAAHDEPAVEFGWADVEKTPSGGWRLLSTDDLKNYRKEFIAAYNSGTGLPLIEAFQSGNCCVAIGGGMKLWITGTKYGFQFPASTLGAVRCNPAGGYNEKHYNLYKLPKMADDIEFSAKAACTTSHNPALYVKEADHLQSVGVYADASATGEVTFGIADAEAHPGGRWQLMGVDDFARHKDAFIKSYNDDGGIATIKPFQSGNCCFGIRGGKKLTITGTPFKFQFPCDPTTGVARCNPTGGYSGKYRFFRSPKLSATQTFGELAACSTRHNPAVYMLLPTGSIEFGLHDADETPPGGWELMSIKDFGTYKKAFVTEYNLNGGLSVIKTFKTRNCCFAVKDESTGKAGLKLTISDTPYGYQFPAASDHGIRCNPSAGYTDPRYAFYRVPKLTLAMKFSESDACATSHNPGIYIRGHPKATTTAPPQATTPAAEVTHCKVSEWSRWGACTVSCAGGTATRSRSIISHAKNGGYVCPSELQETAECNTQKCPVHCEVSVWGDWSQCSASCGKGMQFHTRSVVRKDEHNGTKCPALLEHRACELEDCPVHCAVTDWSSWAPCDAACGGGVERRKRMVTVPPSSTGAQCPHLEDTRACNTKPCPVHCKVSGWSGWLPCNADCGGGFRERQRAVVVDVAYNGNPCPHLLEKQACNTKPCPIHCAVSSWQSWGECSRTCGGGTKHRVRAVLINAAFQGNPCPGLKEDKTCSEHACPVHCKVSKWAAYGECDATCGASAKKWRKRSVVVQAAHGGATCPPLHEGTNCNLNWCPEHCEVSSWSSWSDCTKTCGGGSTSRARSVKAKAKYGGTPCPPLNERLACNASPCPVDCVVSEWSVWSACSVTCAAGTKRRGRTISTPAAAGGVACPALTQEDSCNEGACPVHCQVTSWSEFSACSTTCGKGTQVRKRTITRHASNGGYVCPSLSDERECQVVECPIHCEMKEWSVWGPCSVTCGDGTATRTRKVAVPPQFGGNACPAATGTQPCNEGPCPVHCRVSQWTPWNACSKSCGKGEEVRRRTITTHAAHGGFVCPELSETRQCELRPCPVHCETSDWAVWGKCSVTCAHGLQTRARSVVTAAKHGGQPCGELQQTQRCNEGPCPVHCEVSKWSEWSACSKTCGKGEELRSRVIVTHPAHGGYVCPALQDKRECEVVACPIHCQVSEFSDWSACSVSCGDGSKLRFRRITTPARWGGHACPALVQKARCNLKHCPIHCATSLWSSWRECSRTCGGGTRSRSRTIVTQPAHGGQSCPALSQPQLCNPQHCPVDCTVSDWGVWSLCTATCGGGSRLRMRSIATPRAFGGKACPSLSEMGRCATNNCPIHCAVSDFSEWSSCTKTCGGGKQQRSRQVTVHEQHGGQSCPALEESQACNTNGCPVHCKLADWSTWGACTKTCDGGTQKRTRAILQEPLHGGVVCPPLAATRSCSDFSCPVDCAVDVWGPFSQCSTSCGDGSASRTRAVLSPAQFGGVTCPALADSKPCSQGPCPIHCETSRWSAFSLCSEPCGIGMKMRFRRVVRHADHGGYQCPALFERVQCQIKPCAIDCEVSSFGEWGACDRTCGGGHAKRERTVLVNPAHGGANCPALVERRTCDTAQPCPADCVVTPWGNFGQCSVSCGTGMYERSRVVLAEPRNGGKACPSLTQMESCDAGECAQECELSPWTPWSDCSERCGGGERLRFRTIVKHPNSAGAPCPSRVEREACNTVPCGVDCTVGDWGTWGSCSRTCGSGIKLRKRPITAMPNREGAACPPLEEPLACATVPCTTDCRVSAWSKWGACSEHCGGGTQRRTRAVEAAAVAGGHLCPSLESSRVCNTHSCADDAADLLAQITAPEFSTEGQLPVTYHIAYTTGWFADSSSTSAVHVKLEGTRGTSRAYLLGDSFAQGAGSIDVSVHEDIGLLFRVHLSIDGTDNWNPINFLDVRTPSGQTIQFPTGLFLDNKVHAEPTAYGRFPYVAEKWLRAVVPEVAVPQTSQAYVVTAETGVSEHAGSVSNQYVQLHGTEGDSKFYLLGRNFEAGQTTTTALRVHERIGLLKAITVLAGGDDDWFVDGILRIHTPSDQQIRFSMGFWLDMKPHTVKNDHVDDLLAQIGASVPAPAAEYYEQRTVQAEHTEQPPSTADSMSDLLSQIGSGSDDHLSSQIGSTAAPTTTAAPFDPWAAIDTMLQNAVHTSPDMQNLAAKAAQAAQAPVAPTTPAPTKVGEKGCMVHDKLVPAGWRGHGGGNNYCNLCTCRDGALACTKLQCGVPWGGAVPQYAQGAKVCSHVQCDLRNADGTRLPHDATSAVRISHHHLEQHGGSHACAYNKYDDRCTCYCWGERRKEYVTKLAGVHLFAPTGFDKLHCENIEFKNEDHQPVEFDPKHGPVRVLATVSHTEHKWIAHDPSLLWVEHTTHTHFRVCGSHDKIYDRVWEHGKHHFNVEFYAWQGNSKLTRGNAPWVGAQAGTVVSGLDSWRTGENNCQEVHFSTTFSEVPVVVGTVDHLGMGARGEHATHDAVTAWVEHIAHDAFMVCFRDIAPNAAGRQPLQFNWLAFEHTNPNLWYRNRKPYSAAGHVKAGEWKKYAYQRTDNGADVFLNCKDVAFDSPFGATPTVIVTANHHDSSRTDWAEGTGANKRTAVLSTYVDSVSPASFRVCSAESAAPGTAVKDDSLHWDYVAFANDAYLG